MREPVPGTKPAGGSGAGAGVSAEGAGAGAAAGSAAAGVGTAVDALVPATAVAGAAGSALWTCAAAREKAQAVNALRRCLSPVKLPVDGYVAVGAGHR